MLNKMKLLPARATSFSMLTFNLLAPCYFRYHGRIESQSPPAFLARATQLITKILKGFSATTNTGTGGVAQDETFSSSSSSSTSTSTRICNTRHPFVLTGKEMVEGQGTIQPAIDRTYDLICLQEYWFHRPFQRLFEKHFQDTHAIHALKRSGLKEDGVAIFVSKEKFHVKHVQNIHFESAGDRVAILMHLSPIDHVSPSDMSQSVVDSSFLLVNSHLTFPHNNYNRKLRYRQIESILGHIDAYKKKNSLHSAPVLLCGDFNDNNDPVHKRILDYGFYSVFSKVHGHEADVTHCNHNLAEVGVDFIFQHAPPPPCQKTHDDDEEEEVSKPRLQLTPQDCHLIPKAMPHTTLLKRPAFGQDWKNVDISFDASMDELVDVWGLLSDHRPIYAKFDVHFTPSSSTQSSNQ